MRIISTNGMHNGFAIQTRSEHYEPMAALPARYRHRHIKPPTMTDRARARRLHNGEKLFCSSCQAAGICKRPKRGSCQSCRRTVERIKQVRDWMVSMGELEDKS